MIDNDFDIDDKKIMGWIDEYGNMEEQLGQWMIDEPNVLWEPLYKWSFSEYKRITLEENSTMKTTVEIELLPFRIPNYVFAKEEVITKQERFNEDGKYHLSQLDSLALEALCEEFTKAVFEKAGKSRPPKEGL